MRRSTEQRKAIRQAFDRTNRPLSVQEVLEEAQKQLPGVGIATVYRNLKQMLKDEILKQVELPGESSRYELADLEHHHHFFCRSCERVFDFNACMKEVESLAPQGFAVETHEIILYGHCPDCTT